DGSRSPVALRARSQRDRTGRHVGPSTRAVPAQVTFGERMRRAILTLLLFSGAVTAEAQETPGARQSPTAPSESEETTGASPSPIRVLEPIIVSAPAPVDASSEVVIPGRDFELRPQGRPDDILRSVPGLVIGHPAGGGKAENYLLRGFDADHGTD